MAACAETLTPVLLEAGGKDAMIVDSDADLDAAARGLRLGRADQRRADLHRHRAGLRGRPGLRRLRVPGGGKGGPVDRRLGRDADIGPITMPAQIEVIRRHIEDAVARGGRAVLGGPDAVSPRTCARRCWSTCRRTPRPYARRPSDRP